jgi:acetyltransferase-like isoleucine patch superfamily enzyme
MISLKKYIFKFYNIFRNFIQITNLNKGENCSINKSSILITSGNGEINLVGNNYIGRQVEIGTNGKIKIGNHTSIQDRCIILGDVDIGEYCTFAPNVYISSGRHYYNYSPNYYIKDQDEMVVNNQNLQKNHSKKVLIGDDCWLGINSVIMSGVSIGRGCIVGANSVVTKNIEPFSVVAGSPAQLIKKRLDFIQKTRLTFKNPEDYPNFYKGFKLDTISLNKYKLGIAANSDFSFYLKSDFKSITLTLKKIIADTISLEYNNQEFIIESQEFESLTFNSAQNPYHNFTVKGQNINQDISVIISKQIRQLITLIFQ